LTKVSIYIDNAVWESFKAQVFQKHGNMRKISSEVEEILRAEIVQNQVVLEFKEMGIKAKGTASSQEIKALRPKLKGPSSEDILNEMRQRRVAQTLS
jgi:hypothetical protein